MKEVSRRAFLKTASVAALAVAATGVLTSCSNVPADAPGKTHMVPVNFYEGNSRKILGMTQVEVNVLATKVDTTTVQIPDSLLEGILKGYVVVGNKETPIENGVLWVEIKKEAAEEPDNSGYKTFSKAYFVDVEVGADQIVGMVDPAAGGLTEASEGVFVTNNGSFKAEDMGEGDWVVELTSSMNLPAAALAAGYELVPATEYPELWEAMSMLYSDGVNSYVMAWPLDDASNNLAFQVLIRRKG